MKKSKIEDFGAQNRCNRRVSSSSIDLFFHKDYKLKPWPMTASQSWAFVRAR